MAADHVSGGRDDAKAYLRELELAPTGQAPTFLPETPQQAARLRRLGAS